jgi:hypothetical protein
VQSASPFSASNHSCRGPFTPPGTSGNRIRKIQRCNWLELTRDFPDERECLAAFLALETAEVLAGAKPANLIRLGNRRQSCGRNLFLLWRAFGVSLLADSGLQALPLRESGEGSLLLFFSGTLLYRQLRDPAVAAFLQQLGYPPPGDLPGTLAELQRRFRAGSALPHEIGLFLGYPLKDVAGYMGRTDLPCTGCRMWRIYGDPTPSLALSDRFIVCRNLMAKRLRATRSPMALLLAAPNAARSKMSFENREERNHPPCPS